MWHPRLLTVRATHLSVGQSGVHQFILVYWWPYTWLLGLSSNTQLVSLAFHSTLTVLLPCWPHVLPWFVPEACQLVAGQLTSRRQVWVSNSFWPQSLSLLVGVVLLSGFNRPLPLHTPTQQPWLYWSVDCELEPPTRCLFPNWLSGLLFLSRIVVSSLFHDVW